ncbi:MAG: hypothetical protein ACJA1B_003042, partial [Polaribacter sp.]
PYLKYLLNLFPITKFFTNVSKEFYHLLAVCCHETQRVYIIEIMFKNTLTFQLIIYSKLEKMKNKI